MLVVVAWNNFPISFQHEAEASEFSAVTRLRFVLILGTYSEHVAN
jgi:hypothetical protein